MTAACACAVLLALAVAGGSQRLTIEAGPGDDLAAVVAAAPAGATVVVRPGARIAATVIVDRPVALVGADWPVLDGGGEFALLVIRADSVRVSGLILRNVGTSYVEDRAALRVEGAKDCAITGNRIEDAFFGIYLARTESCSITGNRITGSGRTESASGNGIHLWYSRGIRVADNEVSGHRDGIYLEFVRDTEVRDNRSFANLRYGLHFMFSNDCTYTGNAFVRNAAGVAVMYSRDVHMSGNRFVDSRGGAAYGLLLKDITDGSVRDNTFAGNSVGVHAEGANRILVEGNRFEGNGFAVRVLANSSGSLFTGNVFLRNSFDVTTNSRSSYSTFRGNYWDAYRGYDLDRDGRGDVPYRPVSLFSLLVERNPPALLLLRSFVVNLLDAIERVIPSVTPDALADDQPLMRSPL